MDIAGYILAGGKNTRMMGRKKAFLSYHGVAFSDCVLAALKPLDNIYFSVEGTAPYQGKLPADQMIADKYKAIGPIGGICSGLEECREEALLVIPCDMPKISKQVTARLIDQYERSGKPVIAFAKTRLQPLIGIYTKETLPIIKNLIQAKNYRMMEFLNRIEFETVDFTGLEAQFDNINSDAEYEKLLGDRSYGR